MNLTHVWAMLIPKNTLDRRGSNLVKVHTAPGSKSQITVAVTITASGKKLPEVVIFKGTRIGRIARNELPYFKEELGVHGIYCCQKTPGWTRKWCTSGSRRCLSHICWLHDRISYRKPTVPTYQKCHITTVQYGTSQLAIFWVSGSWRLSWLLLAVTSRFYHNLEQNQ